MHFDKNNLPCDSCCYISMRATGGCHPLLCVYGALNHIAQILYKDDKIETELQSRPTFIVEPEQEESRDDKLARVLILQKELHKIYDELDNTKCEEFPGKERELERMHDIREELDNLKAELGLLPHDKTNGSQ